MGARRQIDLEQMSGGLRKFRDVLGEFDLGAGGSASCRSNGPTEDPDGLSVAGYAAFDHDQVPAGPGGVQGGKLPIPLGKIEPLTDTILASRKTVWRTGCAPLRCQNSRPLGRQVYGRLSHLQ